MLKEKKSNFLQPVHFFFSFHQWRNYFYEVLSKMIFHVDHNIVLHFISSTDGESFNGVVSGGKHVMNEILHVIDLELSKAKCAKCNNGDNIVTDVTISIYGNSLGGIYARYAIAELYEKLSSTERDEDDSKSCSDPKMVMKNGDIKVHFNSFYTFLSPHMGESRHTYFIFTRYAERLLAKMLGQVGQDM